MFERVFNQRFPIPAVPMQRLIVSKLDSIHSQAEKLEQIHQAFNGRL